MFVLLPVMLIYIVVGSNVSWVDQHVYPRIVVSVNYHNTNPTEQVGLAQSRHHLNPQTTTLGESTLKSMSGWTLA
jgi:hypothetical protein